MRCIIDTNIAMGNTPFAEYEKVFVPLPVLEELDKHNHSSDDGKAYSARCGLRNLKFSDINYHNIFYVAECSIEILDSMPAWLDMKVKDNLILAYSYYIISKIDNQAILLTRDLNMSQKAKALNIPCQFFNDSNEDDIYKGVLEYTGDEEGYNEYFEQVKDSMYPNQYLVFHNTSTGTDSELRFDGEKFVSLKLPSNKIIKAKNSLQRCALDLLNNDSITSVAILGGYGCVDCETEFFNGKEWKQISDYDPDDKVLEFDVNSGQAILSKPYAYIKKPCDSFWLFNDNNYGISQCLSEEHEILYKTNTALMEKIPVKEVVDKQLNQEGFDKEIPCTFFYHGDGINYTDEEIRISVLAFCAGRTDRGAHRFILTARTPKRVEQFKAFFEANNTEYYMYGINPEARRYFFNAYRPISQDKFTPDWYNCSLRQLQIICDTAEKLFRIKDHIYKSENILYIKYKENADFLQFAFAACGKRTTIIQNSEFHYKIYIQDNPTISFTKDKYRIKPILVKSTDGYKYCFTMPTGNLILRRNGNIFLTGNSGKTHLCTRMAVYHVMENSQTKLRLSKVVGIREPRGEGKDVGYLKGSFEDKTGRFFKPLEQQLPGGEQELACLMSRGQLEQEIPFYLKGTTFTSSVVVVDEAEDLTESQIVLIGTRLGEDSRIFWSGDYAQSLINKTYGNPLVRMCNQLKGNPTFGCIYLNEDVRSPASKMYANLFK